MRLAVENVYSVRKKREQIRKYPRNKNGKHRIAFYIELRGYVEYPRKPIRNALRVGKDLADDIVAPERYYSSSDAECKIQNNRLVLFVELFSPFLCFKRTQDLAHVHALDLYIKHRLFKGEIYLEQLPILIFYHILKKKSSLLHIIFSFTVFRGFSQQIGVICAKFALNY